MSDLHLSVLPASQRQLWDELSAVPDEFVLYGGTAIALQLGHRQSVDFDFFARTEFDPTDLVEKVSFLSGCEPLQIERNTLTARVERQGPVLVSFFGVPRLPKLHPPRLLLRPRLRLGHLLELGGMKTMVVQKRAEAKDYLDIHALITLGGFSLAQLLGAGRALYTPSFAPEIALKSLCYFDDGNLGTLPQAVRRDLALAVRACDPARLPPP